MPLDQQTQERIFNAVAENRGCPIRCKNPLDAFAAGIVAAIESIAHGVSLDQPAAAQPVPAAPPVATATAAAEPPAAYVPPKKPEPVRTRVDPATPDALLSMQEAADGG